MIFEKEYTSLRGYERAVANDPLVECSGSLITDLEGVGAVCGQQKLYVQKSAFRALVPKAGTAMFGQKGTSGTGKTYFQLMAILVILQTIRMQPKYESQRLPIAFITPSNQGCIEFMRAMRKGVLPGMPREGVNSLFRAFLFSRTGSGYGKEEKEVSGTLYDAYRPETVSEQPPVSRSPGWEKPLDAKAEE